jgi:hypothetical protein
VIPHIRTMSEIYAAIEEMSETQLDELLQAIKDKLDDLRGERPEVNVGDVVQFDVRKATLTGIVEKTTPKRATIKLSTVEGSYTIDTKELEVTESGGLAEGQTTIGEY